MLFAAICLAYLGGLADSTRPSYDSILWAILVLIALILVLLRRGQSDPAPWDEEDEDDQFYD